MEISIRIFDFSELRTVSENFDIFLYSFFSLFCKCSCDRLFKRYCIESEIPGKNTEKICIFIFILNEWINNCIVTANIRKKYFHFFYPFFIRDKKSSFSQINKVWDNIFLIQRNQDIHRFCDIRLFTTDMDIIIIESSFDNRLIFTISDDMFSEARKSARDDIHD